MADLRQRIYIKLRPGVTLTLDGDLTIQLNKDDILWKIYEESNMWILDLPNGMSYGFYSYWDALDKAEEVINGKV